MIPINYYDKFSPKNNNIVVFISKINELNKIDNLPFNVNALAESKSFDDTTKIFDPPQNINKHIKKFLNDVEIEEIALELKKIKK